MLDQEQSGSAGLVREQFHRDELIEKAARLDIDPLMELLIEEGEEEQAVAAAEGSVESAMAVSKGQVPDSELDNSIAGDGTVRLG